MHAVERCQLRDTVPTQRPGKHDTARENLVSRRVAPRLKLPSHPSAILILRPCPYLAERALRPLALEAPDLPDAMEPSASALANADETLSAVTALASND